MQVFEKFCLEYESDVCRIAEKVYNMEKEDAKQELLLAVYEALPAYDNRKASLRTYANRVMRNRAINLGKSKPVRNLSNEIFIGDMKEVDGREKEISTEEDGFIGIEAFIALEQILDKQEIDFIKLKLEGYSNVEISNILDVPYNRGKLNGLVANIRKKMSEACLEF